MAQAVRRRKNQKHRKPKKLCKYWCQNQKSIQITRFCYFWWNAENSPGQRPKGVSDPGLVFHPEVRSNTSIQRFSANIANIAHSPTTHSSWPLFFTYNLCARGARLGVPASNVADPMSPRQAGKSFKIRTFTRVLQSSAADTDWPFCMLAHQNTHFS